MFPLAHMGIPTLIITRFRRDVDLRLLLLALMLPDIIDKPIGHLLLHSLNNGRIFAHTLLFLTLLLILGVRWEAFRWLALGVAIHDALDLMFLAPTTFFWPIFGPFPTTEFTPSTWLYSLFHDPVVLGGEIAGATSFLYIGYREDLFSLTHLLDVVKKGRLPREEVVA
ncbi:MAG: metal-dependent hydrolase [Thermoplasmata archaeon]|nr:metal-dependent hydrolase [Thermoplasmata archaeon]